MSRREYSNRLRPRKIIICCMGIAVRSKWGHFVKMGNMTPQEMLPNSPPETHTSIMMYLLKRRVDAKKDSSDR